MTESIKAIASDALTDEECERWSEEFAQREFAQEELDRVFSTWRRIPRSAPQATESQAAEST